MKKVGSPLERHADWTQVYRFAEEMLELDRCMWVLLTIMSFLVRSEVLICAEGFGTALMIA